MGYRENRNSSPYASRFADMSSPVRWERSQTIPHLFASSTTMFLEDLEIGQIITVDGESFIYRGLTEDGKAILDPVKPNPNVE